MLGCLLLRCLDADLRNSQVLFELIGPFERLLTVSSFVVRAPSLVSMMSRSIGPESVVLASVGASVAQARIIGSIKNCF